MRPTSPDSEGGETTQELRRRFEPKAKEEASKVKVADQKIRTRGNWLILTGVVTVILVLLCSLIWHAGMDEVMPAVYAVPLYAVGFGAAFLGTMEVMFRPYRDAQNRVSEDIARVENGLRLLVHLLPEELQQRFYKGYGLGHRDARQANTGTEGIPPQRGPGDVLKLRRRNDRTS
jgi:hypothetical protein